MRRFKNVLITAFILILCIFIARDNYQKLLPFFKSEIKLAKKTFFSDSKEKLAAHHGKEVLNYIRAAVNATPTNAQIMVPPQQEPWPIVGNREFMQYFFYPRKLIHENLDKVEADPNLTHILVAWGESTGYNAAIRGWPKFFIPVRRIYFPKREKEIKVFQLKVTQNSKNLLIFEPELKRGLQPLTTLVNYKSDVAKNKAGSEIIEVEGVLAEKVSASYTSAGFDYWGVETKLSLTPSTKIQAKILSNLLDSVGFVAKVDYKNGTSAFFSSQLNQSLDQEVLKMDNLHVQAIEFAKIQKLPVSGLTVSFVGFDLGHQAHLPYLEKWGIGELEKGNLDLGNQNLENSFYTVQLATKELVLGNFEEAAKHALLATILDDSYLWPKIILTQIYFESGKLEEAAKIYQDITLDFPDLAWPYFQLGQIYQKQDREELALKSLLKAREVSPEPPWINLAIGDSYERQGDLASAANFYREAAARNAYIFTQSGAQAQQNLLKIQADQRKVIAEKEVILKQDPENVQINLELALTYFIAGKKDKADQIYKKLAQFYPGLEFPQELTETFTFEDSFDGTTRGDANLDDYRDFVQGVLGLAVDFGVGEYVAYRAENLPQAAGTVEFDWRPSRRLIEKEDEGKFTTLVYQPGAKKLSNGLFVFASRNNLNLGIFEAEQGRWHFVQSNNIPFSPDSWYRITISFGPAGMGLRVNNQTFVNKEFRGGIGKTPLFVGSAQGYFFDLSPPAGSFDELKFFNFQKP